MVLFRERGIPFAARVQRGLPSQGGSGHRLHLPKPLDPKPASSAGDYGPEGKTVPVGQNLTPDTISEQDVLRFGRSEEMSVSADGL